MAVRQLERQARMKRRWRDLLDYRFRANRFGLFWFAELVLAILAVCLVAVIFLGNDDKKRVAVIVSDADSGTWDRFIAGIKQGAAEENLRIVITGTGPITSAEEERTIIEEEIAGGADALIVQPSPGEDTAAMLEEISDRLPVMLIKDTPYMAGESGTNVTSELPIVQSDHEETARMLAEMILEDYAWSLSGKTMGIVTAQEDTTSMEQYLQGFLDGIENSGAEIMWTMQAGAESGDTEVLLKDKRRVDLIAVLDIASTDTVGDLSANGRLHGAVVYGIGTSKKALNHLDHDDIAGLVIPNDYNVGYLAINEIATRLSRRFYRMRSQTVEAGVYRREDLFLRDNTDFLFVGEY